MRVPFTVCACVWVLACMGSTLVYAANFARSVRVGLKPIGHPLTPTHSGYLQVLPNSTSAIYFAYYEAQTSWSLTNSSPIVLWLQGGPGCASTFGSVFEVGPWRVTQDLELFPNPGAWNQHFGLLLLDQPVGVGYSIAQQDSDVPIDELGVAVHMYTALQTFFSAHAALRHRPFFVTGESYGGKFVSSLAHFVLQLQLQHSGDASQKLNHPRLLPAGLPPPAFNISGIALGNPLVCPRSQLMTLSSTAAAFGVLSPALETEVTLRSLEIVQMIDDKQWVQAHAAREALRTYIESSSGIGTMLDVRRSAVYDPASACSHYLNMSHIKDVMGANASVNYVSCSSHINTLLAADTMKCVTPLYDDLLVHMPVLLYQGQFDLLDGVASTEAWLSALNWTNLSKFDAQPGSIWKTGGVTSGWVRSYDTLTHAVVYGAGHLAPHDQPEAVLNMLETWVGGVMGVGGGAWNVSEGGRHVVTAR